MTHIKRTLSRMRLEDHPSLFIHADDGLLDRAFGIEAHLISPEEAKKKWPLLSTNGLTGALWIPHDGVVGPPFSFSLWS